MHSLTSQARNSIVLSVKQPQQLLVLTSFLLAQLAELFTKAGQNVVCLCLCVSVCLSGC